MFESLGTVIYVSLFWFEDMFRIYGLKSFKLRTHFVSLRVLTCLLLGGGKSEVNVAVIIVSITITSVESLLLT